MKRGIAAAVLTLVVMGSVATPTPAGATPAPRPYAPDFACTLPDLSRTIAGPAASALTGGAARTGFTLDGNGLVVKPPQPGDRPVLTAHQALCAALAVVNQTAPFNLTTQRRASAAWMGVAVGYGRVSVRQNLFPATSPAANFVDTKFPVIDSFKDKLAWLVVTEMFPRTCPGGGIPGGRTVHTTPTLPTDHGYQVFMVNALTGRDALIYGEGHPTACGPGRTPPSVTQPIEQVSVPWKLVSRPSKSETGVIAAAVLPCDGYQTTTTLTIATHPVVTMVVTRPVGASCGKPKTVKLALSATVPFANVAPVIKHGPLGLVVNVTPNGLTRSFG